MSEQRTPSQFPSAPLRELASRITDGSHFSPAPQEHGYLIANVKDMKSGFIDLSSCTRISAAAYRELNATGCTIRNGNVLLSKDGTVGRVVVYQQNDEIGALSSICIIVPAEGIDSAYLGHALQSEICVRQFENFMSGSALRRLVLRDIRTIEIPLPSVEQQSLIAKILDTLDTAIRETEALIDKLKAVKQGLLHDLLTRGIDANGQLRPPQSETPQLYKESPLGWIPREWEVVEIGEVLLGIDAGWSPSCPEEPPSAGEWGVLKLSAITSGQYNSAEAKRLPSDLKPIPSLEVHAGDVLLARANGVAEFVARTVFVEETPSLLMLSDKTLRLVPDQSRLLAGHLVRAMAFEKTRQQIGGMLNGSSGQKNISQQQICKLLMCLPSVLEQDAGDSRVGEINQRLKAENLSLGKLFELKAGLTEDLLTGRVRVTTLLESVQQTAAQTGA